jgi:hypothetical protein
MSDLPIEDIIEMEQLLATYAVAMTSGDVETVQACFAPDGWYSAFGDVYELKDYPKLIEAAPKGVFMTGTPELHLDVAAGTGSGRQTLLFVDQTNHHMRMGWYTDSYRRTEQGWRIATRSMTFLRRNGSRDAGRPHDPNRPEPTRKA